MHTNTFSHISYDNAIRSQHSCLLSSTQAGFLGCMSSHTLLGLAVDVYFDLARKRGFVVIGLQSWYGLLAHCFINFILKLHTWMLLLLEKTLVNVGLVKFSNYFWASQTLGKGKKNLWRTAKQVVEFAISRRSN